MADKLTPQQLLAVNNTGGKLLVSAAAGSGKTKVLVDRLLKYVQDPVLSKNVDDFLIITYTKAAAAELRGKIAARLSELIADDPGNRHLQVQMQRLYLAKISTIHSFCGDILREYAYMADVPADFRVADENECLEIQTVLLDQLLNDAYESSHDDPDFRSFIDTQGFGRDDRLIPLIILKVYNSARCHLQPDKWINWCLESACVEEIIDAGETIWGKYLMDDLRQYLDLQINALQKCVHHAQNSEGMEKPVILLQDTIFQLQRLRNCNTWDEIVTYSQIEYGVLRFSKKCIDLDLADKIKAVRNECKNGVAKKLRSISEPSAQVLRDLRESASAIRGLIHLVNIFADRYQQIKKARHIMDFSDLEHKLLDLLLGKRRSGPTALAYEIGARFYEVMVDEYQDSNAVQDAIFDALTRQRQNCFLVGDVKQSIYQFRLAEPGIFVEKYNAYAPAETAQSGQGRKVQLSSNFRSSYGVISAVNDVFSGCMSPAVGGLYYGEEEALREGVPHIPLDSPEVELYGIQVKEDTYAEEAAFVADKVQSLLSGSIMVRDGENLRKITADDIVILLRSPGSVGGEFAYALESRGIRCSVGGNIDILQTEEISFFVSMLQIINNPLQDIPLIAVLTNRVFGFSADEITQIRCNGKNCSFYEALKKTRAQKVEDFCAILQQLRRDARMMTLTQLMQKILLRTKMDSIYSALPDGACRMDNIQFFCQLAQDYELTGQKDMYQFLEHISSMAEKGLVNTNDPQNSDTVRIMSIHKSKGLEFPVVFLCGLSRMFNQESVRAQVLCDKTLGIGLSCIDRKNRVRYPSVAKRAIAEKIIADSVSEELRVLYVAMTRPKDRLIMTYAVSNLETQLQDIALRYDLTEKQLMTQYVSCPGEWVLQTAMQRTEAGAFFALGGRPNHVETRDSIWRIEVVEGQKINSSEQSTEEIVSRLSDRHIQALAKSLRFRYAHSMAAQVPSKVTATQMKGRYKDQEVAEYTQNIEPLTHQFRDPGFTEDQSKGTDYGNAIHTVMHHIRFDACKDLDGIRQEIDRLVSVQILTAEEGALICSEQIFGFFETELGKKLMQSSHVIREFKFSILQDADKYYPGLVNEKLLVQGVVDCCLIEDDGITVIDFKSDRITEQTVQMITTRYSEQLCVYADSLEDIYHKPVKAKYLYFFRIGKLIEIQ